MTFIATRAAVSSHQVSYVLSNYSDLNPKRTYRRNSSSVILNCFRVLNTSGEIISFHLRKISIYPFRLRKHAEPTKKRKTSKSGCLQTIQLTKQKAEETKKDPVYHGYHLFNGAGAVAGPAALFASFREESIETENRM